MAHRQDSQLTKTKTATAITPGQLNSLEPPYVDFLATTDPTSGDAQDAWMAFWDELGIGLGNFGDRAYKWLGTLGHTEGDLASRWKSYWGLILADDFDRANGALGTPWVTTAVDPLIINANTARAGGVVGASQWFYSSVIEAGSPDVDITATLNADAGWATGAINGIVFRFDGTNSGFMFGYIPTIPEWNLNRIDDGALNTIFSAAAPPVTSLPITLRVTAKGRTLTAYVDGALIGSDESSIYLNETLVGLSLRNTNGNPRWDNFIARYT